MTAFAAPRVSDPGYRSDEVWAGAQDSADPLASRRQELALRARGVVADFRQPDVIRLAPVPLYNTFHEVWRVGRILEEVLSAEGRVQGALPAEHSGP